MEELELQWRKFCVHWVFQWKINFCIDERSIELKKKQVATTYAV